MKVTLAALNASNSAFAPLNVTSCPYSSPGGQFHPRQPSIIAG
ncbi:hypothetical protein [Kibdelosporangium philippinense]